ncbi:hypothetical protein ADUPG1_005902 [Aduncisulcus paluster]|uniref:Uncharacterized protein n=1 Tax=Aduncisulcus paluster TaxID=2918883 RepID=A0ABQ5KG10_9EUKA|nr:hypothetical protein ADUPG1_005902 [Aduncisulcus paluster]
MKDSGEKLEIFPQNEEEEWKEFQKLENERQMSDYEATFSKNSIAVILYFIFIIISFTFACYTFVMRELSIYRSQRESIVDLYHKYVPNTISIFYSFEVKIALSITLSFVGVFLMATIYPRPLGNAFFATSFVCLISSILHFVTTLPFPKIASFFFSNNQNCDFSNDYSDDNCESVYSFTFTPYWMWVFNQAFHPMALGIATIVSAFVKEHQEWKLFKNRWLFFFILKLKLRNSPGRHSPHIIMPSQDAIHGKLTLDAQDKDESIPTFKDLRMSDTIHTRSGVMYGSEEDEQKEINQAASTSHGQGLNSYKSKTDEKDDITMTHHERDSSPILHLSSPQSPGYQYQSTSNACLSNITDSASAEGDYREREDVPSTKKTIQPETLSLGSKIIGDDNGGQIVSMVVVEVEEPKGMTLSKKQDQRNAEAVEETLVKHSKLRKDCPAGRMNPAPCMGIGKRRTSTLQCSDGECSEECSDDAVLAEMLVDPHDTDALPISPISQPHGSSVTISKKDINIIDVPLSSSPSLSTHSKKSTVTTPLLVQDQASPLSIAPQSGVILSRYSRNSISKDEDYPGTIPSMDHASDLAGFVPISQQYLTNTRLKRLKKQAMDEIFSQRAITSSMDATAKWLKQMVVNLLLTVFCALCFCSISVILLKVRILYSFEIAVDVVLSTLAIIYLNIREK